MPHHPHPNPNPNPKPRPPTHPQLLDRSRHGAVVGALSGGAAAGLLALLIHRGVASLTGREADLPVRYSTAFIEALLSMVGALVTSTSGERRVVVCGVDGLGAVRLQH